MSSRKNEALIDRKSGAIAPRRRWGARDRKTWVGIGLILPSVIALGVVIVKPLLDSFWMSVHELDLLFGTGQPFVGFRNFVWLFQSDWFFPTLLRTIFITVVVTGFQVVFAMAFALLTDFDFPGKSVVRSLVVAPWALPIFVAGLIWTWIYEPDISPINAILQSLGVIDDPVPWLSRRETALPAVMLALIWKGLPFMYLATLAGLQQIDQDHIDSARIDGANAWQEFRHVILPGLRYILTTIIILRSIFLFNHFAYIWVLTGGGPLNATEVLAISAVKVGVNSFRYGRAAAITTTMFFVLFGLFLVYYWADRKNRIGKD
jgi:multiple sugar transport system permease protein